MKLSKTIIFFTITGILGLITALEAIDLKSFLLPMICHVDPNVQYVADECTDKMVAFAGKWTAFLSAVGIALRAITTNSLFLSLFGGKDKDA